MKILALAIGLLLPITLSASQHKKTENKSKLYTIKEEMDYRRFLERIRTSKMKYKAPQNTPIQRPVTPPAQGDPFPEIVIEFVAYDEAKK